MASGRFISVDYEVFGRVQGVFFRKHTQATARKLGLVGWVMNTSKGTVKGVVQGPEEKVKEMKHWLEKTGSPESQIEKAAFDAERPITKPEFSKFDVRGY